MYGRIRPHGLKSPRFTSTRPGGERENFGPGTTRDLAVTLDAGNYDVACKPKMTGDGIRTKITVTK
ncbi:MAG TPA: hypothetical protein VFE45_13345 [Coriobacteriia bacterium]|nr:hypothetical protein [Coriobacteriia bacterium]